MDKNKIAKELVALARELVSAKKPKYTEKDVKKVTADLEEYVKRGGRDYGDYQFNIKLQRIDIPDSVREQWAANSASDFAVEEAAQRVATLGEQVKQRFKWVKECGSAGRSGGWFAIVDGDFTMESLEEAVGKVESQSELDKDDEYFDEEWDELEEEVVGAVEEGKGRLRDLAEIEKMVKSEVSAYEKDMESERWWKSYR